MPLGQGRATAAGNAIMLKGCLGLLAVVILGIVVLRLIFGAVGILAQVLGVVPMPIWILVAGIILIWLWRSGSGATSGG